MTKSDLVNGMVIQYREGKKALVYKHSREHILISLDAFMPLDRYSEDLTYNSPYNDPDGNQWDIVTVYEMPLSMGLEKALYFADKVIWKRKEIVELTLKEVADRLGIPVEQLRIKD